MPKQLCIVVFRVSLGQVGQENRLPASITSLGDEHADRTVYVVFTGDRKAAVDQVSKYRAGADAQGFSIDIPALTDNTVASIFLGKPADRQLQACHICQSSGVHPG